MPSWSSVVKGSPAASYSTREAIPAGGPLVTDKPSPSSVWNELPPNFTCEVVRQLLSVHMDSLCSISQVSTAWARAARQATRSLVLNTSWSRVCAKVAALDFFRRAGSFCSSVVTIKLEEPVDLGELANLADDLQNQVQGNAVTTLTSTATSAFCFCDTLWLQAYMLSSCMVQLELLVPAEPYDLLEQCAAAQLTDVIPLLFQKHDVALHVTIGRGASAPSPETLALLAGFLSQLDFYSVPRQHAALTHPLPAADDVSFAAAHLNALINASSLLTVCAVTVHEDLADDIGLKCLAQLTNLTKLHLTDTQFNRPDRQLLQPLGQLSLLSDLVLQCPEEDTCCKEVLNSSRHTLCSVDLNAPSWSTATYNSLRQLSQLEFLAVNIGDLSIDQAKEMAGIRATLFSLCYSLDYQELDRPDGFKPLQTLHAQKAEIHDLTLECCSDELLSYVNLPTLTNLTLEPQHILECTTSTLQCHTNVRHLTFRNWRGMRGSHMEQLIYSLPALTGLSFCNSTSPEVKPDTTLYQWCWHVLPCAQRLQLIDLRGLHGLKVNSISRLCHAFHEAQAANTAQSVVSLLLPDCSLGLAVPILKTVCIGNVGRVYQVQYSNECRPLTIAKDKPTTKVCIETADSITRTVRMYQKGLLESV